MYYIMLMKNSQNVAMLIENPESYRDYLFVLESNVFVSVNVQQNVDFGIGSGREQLSWRWTKYLNPGVETEVKY